MADLKSTFQLVEERGGVLFDEPTRRNLMRRLVERAARQGPCSASSKGDLARRNSERGYHNKSVTTLQFHQQPGALLQREMEKMTPEERQVLETLKSEELSELDLDPVFLDDTHLYGSLKTRRTLFAIRMPDNE